MELTKHPRFRFMPGMLTTTGRRVLDVYQRYDDEPSSVMVTSVGADTSVFWPISSVSVETFSNEHGDLDLTDAATVGCLTALYRESAGYSTDWRGERVARDLMALWNGEEVTL